MVESSNIQGDETILWTRQLHEWADTRNREEAKNYRQRAEVYGVQVPAGLDPPNLRYKPHSSDAERWKNDAEYWRDWSTQMQESAEDTLTRAGLDPLGSRDAVGRFESAADYLCFSDLARRISNQAFMSIGSFRHRGKVERRSQWVEVLNLMADWRDKRADWHKDQVDW